MRPRFAIGTRSSPASLAVHASGFSVPGSCSRSVLGSEFDIQRSPRSDRLDGASYPQTSEEYVRGNEVACRTLLRATDGTPIFSDSAYNRTMRHQNAIAVTVRRAVRADVPRLAELLSEFRTIPMSVVDADNRFSVIERDPDQELLVACASGQVVALLAFRLRQNLESVSHYGEIATIVVDRAHRGHRIGEALVDAAQELAEQRACVGLWLVSGFGREEEAHRFYERLGFQKTGVRFVKALGG